MSRVAPSHKIVDTACYCERCTSRTKAMYALDAHCLNCGDRFILNVRFGDKPPLSVECPSCGVNEYSWRVGAGPAPAPTE